MRHPSRTVAFATFIYFAVFSALGADRYLTFHSGADLGLFAQTIATAFHGFRNTFEGQSHFAYHFSPVLYLCAPLLWLTHSALALVLVQAAATALIAPALYAIARRRTSDRNAALLACIALLYPPLQGVTFTDFHEVAFAPAVVAWLLWAIDTRRFAIAYALVAVALGIKEDQAPAMGFLGLAAVAYFAPRRERGGVVFGAIASVASVLVFVGYFAVIRPWAGAAGHWMPIHFYAWNSPRHAMPLTQEIVGRLTYLLEAFVPLAFIPLRSRIMLLALPGFTEVLASHEPLAYTMGQHYAAVWVPYVLTAFVAAAAQWLRERPAPGMRWVRASVVLSLLVSVFFSPLHLGHFLRPLERQDAATNALIARVPRLASIGTYDEIYAHLGFYPRAQVGLRGRPAYVLMNRRYASTAWDTRSLPVLRRDVARGVYRPIDEIDGVVLFARRPGRAH